MCNKNIKQAGLGPIQEMPLPQEAVIFPFKKKKIMKQTTYTVYAWIQLVYFLNSAFFVSISASKLMKVHRNSKHIYAANCIAT